MRSPTRPSWWHWHNRKGWICWRAQQPVVLLAPEHPLHHANTSWTYCSGSNIPLSAQRSFRMCLGWDKTELCSSKVINMTLSNCEASPHYHVSIHRIAGAAWTETAFLRLRKALPSGLSCRPGALILIKSNFLWRTILWAAQQHLQQNRWRRLAMIGRLMIFTLSMMPFFSVSLSRL